MKTGCNVYDAMTKRPVTVKLDASIEDCAKIMKKEAVGSVVIVEADTCVGILTESDIIKKIIAEEKDVSMLVREVMSKNLITVNPNQDIYDAAVIMRNSNIRHVIVMDDKKFMGFLTAKDVLKIQPQLFDLLIEKIELREETEKPIFKFYEKDGICELCGEYSTKIYDVDDSKVCVKCRKDMEN